MDGVRSARPDKPYQRTYKACIPCRQRKAKCDLGTDPGGLPIGPPCARCRRELRECVFPEKRAWERSRKRARSPESYETDVSPRHATQLTKSPDSSIPVQGRTQNLHHTSDVANLTPETNFQKPPGFQSGWPYHRGQAGSHHGSLDHPSVGPSRTDQSPSHTYENNTHRANSTLASSMMRTVVTSGNDALNILFEAATAQEDHSPDTGSESLAGPPSTGPSTQGRTPGNYDSAFESVARIIRPVKLSDATQDTLNVWEACRFVKMGWFTAREAVTFVDLFYKNMSCLSPILTDFYANHRYHYWLISREPVLCSTILMISSRYHVLPGAGGESRNFFIHHRLWSHCQKLTMRLIFGQEKSTKSKVRSLGTVEALLLMSEWHPRALHFPPETDGWDDDLIPEAPRTHDNNDSNPAPGNRGVEDIIEPARRSDQMSWMLLGCALSLGHELGIFETEGSIPPANEPEWRDQMAIRWQRVQRLLYVYINQLAWRIGCMSPIPQSLTHAILGGRKPQGLSPPGSTWLTFMDSWIELTKLAKSVTDMFFPSAAFARQQLHSGRYVGLLEHFRPLLNQWKDKYLQPQVLDKAFYNDLFIEYHFVRVYTHSVGMQAVVERAVAENDPNNFDGVRPMTIDSTDYEYIQEVIDGCGQILQKVTHLAEAGALRFSPVRIVLRITSASIFLMKALSLGTRQAKLQESIEILEKSIKALKSNALDDVHLSTRYAALLDMHVSRLRRNLLASSKVAKGRDAPRSSPMGPPPWPETGDRSNPINTPVLQGPPPDMGFIPSLNDIGADNWLSLPFDPSMAPFDMTHGCQFPMYEGGALDFIWNLPS
ncbi:transcriptional regulator family: Fungal Specific TF [Penicillium roqueforti]|nr:transcriptional regulator family: Fungal Specific TF [Penicillium roqueforti]KAI3125595.1 transcriptional regulator family: Fungal Specific TF [Penicillium roqueforti]